MSLFRRMALIALGAFVVVAVVFAPTAAAYIFPKIPAPTTVMVERAAPMTPVMADASLLIKRPSGLGSAFHIGGGRIVTAAHVVVGAKVVSIKSWDGRISSATVVAVDEKTDVAILQTNMKLLAADLSCGVVPVGTPLMAIGNPMGQEFVTVWGKVAGAPRDGLGRLLYVTDMTTVMGQSGGGVFADGRVIGVTSAVMLAPLQIPGSSGSYVPTIVGLGYVVPSTVVCEMIAKLDAEGPNV